MLNALGLGASDNADGVARPLPMMIRLYIAAWVSRADSVIPQICKYAFAGNMESNTLQRLRWSSHLLGTNTLVLLLAAEVSHWKCMVMRREESA